MHNTTTVSYINKHYCIWYTLTTCHVDSFPFSAVVGRFTSTGAHLAACYTWLSAVASHISKQKWQTIVIWSSVYTGEIIYKFNRRRISKPLQGLVSRQSWEKACNWWLYMGANIEAPVKINYGWCYLLLRFVFIARTTVGSQNALKSINDT